MSQEQDFKTAINEDERNSSFNDTQRSTSMASVEDESQFREINMDNGLVEGGVVTNEQVIDQEDIWKVGGLSCWQTFLFFMKHAKNDVKRRKCHFCLAFCTVFIVVLAALIVNTIVDQGPVVFMKLAEEKAGQIDAAFAVRFENLDQGINQVVGWEFFLNYTRMDQLLNKDKNGDNYVHTPRMKFTVPKRTQLKYMNGTLIDTAVPPQTPTINFLDTQREQEIGIGTSFPWPDLKKDECVLHQSFQKSGKLDIGDEIKFTIQYDGLWIAMLNNYNPWKIHFNGKQRPMTRYNCTVAGFYNQSYGKFPGADTSYVHIGFQDWIGKFANDTTWHKSYDQGKIQALKAYLNEPGRAYDFSTLLLMNFPSPRYAPYQSASYQQIKENVIQYFSPVISELGFYPIEESLLLLDSMAEYDYTVMLIGLVFDILIIIFVIVACLLIYALLLMSVETKTFDIAVIRLLGLTSRGFIGLIMTQAGFFVVPSVILAFLLVLPTIYFLMAFLYSDISTAGTNIYPSLNSVLTALFIGVLIPLLSSIVPIRRALSKNLTDALNFQRQQNTGIMVSFVDNSSKNLVPYLLFGSITVSFGVAIYIFLPLALLQENFSLLLQIFFLILLGMLLGLTLMVTNLQGLFEVGFSYLLFFWEAKSLTTLLRKNMKAHKNRNRLTSIIFALSLGCIIFLLTAASLQVQAIDMQNKISTSDIILTTGKGCNGWAGIQFCMTANNTDPILVKYKDQIKDFGYVSQQNGALMKDVGMSISDRANLQSKPAGLQAFGTSKLLDSAMAMSYVDTETELGPTEQLYTQRGSQSLGTEAWVSKLLGINTDNYKDLFLNTIDRTKQKKPNLFYQNRALWTTKRTAPFSSNGVSGNSDTPYVYSSWPMVAYKTNVDFDNVTLSMLLIEMNDPNDHATIDAITSDLEDILPKGSKVEAVYKAESSTNNISAMLELVFSIIIAIMMFLCFFSLSASMSANLFDQRKEIGIIRSMGFTKNRIRLLYFYEALILVLTSSMLGIFIGFVVGYTMSLQQDLFLNTDTQFYFPWIQTVEIFGLSIICAFLSTWGPSVSLTKKEISVLFR